jgi:4-aminobutyrate aminotransferase-like enzyme
MKNIKDGFGPLAPGIIRVYYPYCYRCYFEKTYPNCEIYCIKDLEYAIHTQSSGSIAALLMEPYLGAGGAINAPVEYIQQVWNFCRQQDIIFIFDEIQSSFGRTGSMFAFEQLGIEPDLLCLGKGISSGIPMSAVAMQKKLSKYLRPGAFGSTYGGFNPLACAAGLATLSVLEEEKIIENALHITQIIMGRLKDIQNKHSIIGEVRGMGLSMGVEFITDTKSRDPAGKLAYEVARLSIESGLAVLLHPGGFWENVLRIMPPLIIDEESVKAGMDIFEASIEKVEEQFEKGKI